MHRYVITHRVVSLNACMCVYICMYIYIYIYIGERYCVYMIYTHASIHICTYIMYVYVYIERERASEVIPYMLRVGN